MKIQLTLLITILSTSVCGQVIPKHDPTHFIPKGFVLFEEINGDLNKDRIDDLVLIIKGTDKKQIETDEYRGQLDRNRRGIIVFFKNNMHYELVVKNYDCFSSENEDGGVYYAPELGVEVYNGNLIAHYSHGRYGSWKYTFRFNNSDFELIGYDSNYRSDFISDWVTFDEVSVNFLTKKEFTKEVIKVTSDGKEVFKKTWKNISINELIKLSDIKDFDQLDMNYSYR